MKISREIAQKINPLIGNLQADTLHNISGMVGLVQDLSIFEPELHLSKHATKGFFCSCEIIHGVLNLEL